MNAHTPDIRFQLYQTDEYPCPYLPEQLAQSQFVLSSQATSKAHTLAPSIDDHTYTALMHQGFRRSGTHVHRPHCPNCQACVPMRVLAGQFTHTRSQRRCQAKWRGLTVHIQDLVFKQAHFELYQRYIKSRHADGPMANDGEREYRNFCLNSPITSFLVEFRDQHQQVRMVCIIDQCSDGLSAMYTFFDPSPEYSGLGTYGILWQIEIAQKIGLQYVYLGYWIEHAPTMRYKQKFTPAQLLTPDGWTTVTFSVPPTQP